MSYNIEICDAELVYYCDSEIWLSTFNVHFIIKLWDIKEALYDADFELEAADLQLVFDLEPWWCRFESDMYRIPIYLSICSSVNEKLQNPPK